MKSKDMKKIYEDCNKRCLKFNLRKAQYALMDGRISYYTQQQKDKCWVKVAKLENEEVFIIYKVLPDSFEEYIATKRMKMSQFFKLTKREYKDLLNRLHEIATVEFPY
jgi:hypothetical protein